MSATIRLIGTIRFERSDGSQVSVEAIPTVKALDLLRLLATREQEWVRADYYIAQLWPDADDDKGRASLRTAVAQLRRVLGPDTVRRAGDLLSLGDVATDVADLRARAAEVETARRAGRDDEVVALVRAAEETCGGHLVVSRSSCEAVYAERDELRELRSGLLLDAAAAAARCGWLRDALSFARRADGLNPTEASARALMTAWAGLGETARAVQTFERLTAHLAETYGVQPAPRTRAQYLEVVTAGERLRLAPPQHHPRATAELVATLTGLLDAPQPGGVVWLLGEPGSGRDAVARQARDRVVGRRGPVGVDVDVLPEIVDLDDVEAERLRREAHACGRVLVVPVRAEVPGLHAHREAVVRVDRLTRSEFRDLLCQLLQDRPAPELEARLWSVTGALAGQVCRTVTLLVRDAALVWTPGAVGLATRDRTFGGGAAGPVEATA